MYALVDCNNFYASCERVFNPKLIGKPIVVLSNNDGCIIARSQEAKDIGLPMGAPIHELRNMVALHNVNVFSANFQLYGDMSHRVMRILNSYVPQMEIYSIDESFLLLGRNALKKAEGHIIKNDNTDATSFFESNDQKSLSMDSENI